jgi:hypothetical protein
VTRVLLGRALAIAGIVCGLLAVGLSLFSSGGRYVEDGSVAAFLIVLLSLASWLPAEIGRDLLAAAAGAAAFGYYLFLPAVYAFDRLGSLGPGAWLGICAGLVPVGALVISGAPGTPRRSRQALAGVDLPVALAGLVLVVVGIWLDLTDGGPSYWNVSSSGHAVGILMLLLVAVNVVLLAGPVFAPIPSIGGLDLLVAATTFGFVEAGIVSVAFEDFGDLGAGAWIEAAGGALLLAGVLRLRAAPTLAPEPQSAMAAPAA